jgi:hypothetical protein
MGNASGARVSPQRATRPPLGLRVSDEGARARLALGGVVAALAWPRTLARGRAEAEARRRVRSARACRPE